MAKAKSIISKGGKTVTACPGRHQFAWAFYFLALPQRMDLMHTYAAFAKPPVVTIDGVDWINPSVKSDTDLDPLARDMLPIVRGKKTTVLGVLDGPSFRKWWDYICGCTGEESIISIRMNFSDGWRDARSAIVHVEDHFHFKPVDRKALLRMPEDRGLDIPTDSFICVSVDIIKPASPLQVPSEQSDSAEILIRTKTLDDIIHDYNFWVSRTGQKLSSIEAWEKNGEFRRRTRDENEIYLLSKIIIGNVYRFSADILLLGITPTSGFLKIVTGERASLFRRAQSSLAQINYEYDKLWQEDW